MHLFVLHNFLRGAAGAYQLSKRLFWFEDEVVFGLLEHARSSLASNTPVRTGRMRAGWGVKRLGYAYGGIVNAQYYALFQFTGTQPHTIQPKPGHPALAFTNGGSQAFRRGTVQHPGQQPNQELWSTLLGEQAEAEAVLSSLGIKFAVRVLPGIMKGG